jgi:hypothetical protein
MLSFWNPWAGWPFTVADTSRTSYVRSRSESARTFVASVRLNVVPPAVRSTVSLTCSAPSLVNVASAAYAVIWSSVARSAAAWAGNVPRATNGTVREISRAAGRRRRFSDMGRE